ncbi:MAG: FAD-binding protein [Planctomycetota bacterium]|nr:FAD-binding protein [Planctomycetota bacterium]
MSPSNLTALLQRSIRRGRVLTSPAQLAGYDADGLGYKTFRPDAVVIPADTDELVQLLRDSREMDVPVTIRGAGTSLSGGPVAAQGGVVIHTSALKHVRKISREGYWCEVECSVVLNQLDAALLPHGLFYPPDPSSGPVCTLGGNVAMNAGGAHCFRYGVTSNYVLGLEVVLLDGSVHRFGGPAGGRGDWREDWKRLMVGSEGTLGAFTRFWLRLLPRPEKVWTYRATFSDLQSAEKSIHALAVHASFPVAIELMDPRCVAMVENSPMAVGLPKDVFLLVTEIDGPTVLVNARAMAVAALLNDSGALSVEYSDDEEKRKGLWKARKVAGGLMGQISPDFLVQDAVIPKRALAELLQLVYDEADAAGLPAVNVFHAGDGNLHPNFMFDSRKPGELEKVEAISKRLMQRVVAVGGTLSGEHGIGNDKTAYMPLVFGEHTLRLQLAVPKIFNPRHQMNPLKVFAARRFDDTASGAVSAPRYQNVAELAIGHTNEDRSPDQAQRRSGTVDSPAGTALRSVRPTATADARLFEPFFDSIDGTMCGPATMTATDLDTLRASHGFRFPLILDQHVPLCEQVAASGFASASSRFGPYCDNILGMNWKLPGGRIVRIGERVVKSTTGYDLLRFLLHSSGQFGEPVDFVIRLRPDCGTSGVFSLSGNFDAVSRATAALLSTCWIHWFDAVDVLFDTSVELHRMRISLNCPIHEWSVYEEFLTSFATTHQLSLVSDSTTQLSPDGCPDFVLKTTPDQAITLAREIARDNAMTCIALCYNGVVHGYLSQHADSRGTRESSDQVLTNSATETITGMIHRCSHALHEIGGDWQSRHIPANSATGVEADWLKLLEQDFAFV